MVNTRTRRGDDPCGAAPASLVAPKGDAVTYPQSRPQYPAAYPQQAPYAMPLRNSGLSVAGMVLGILTLVGFWVPIGAVVMGVLAVALSGAGIAQTAKPGWSGRGMAVTGLVCGIVGLVPSVLFMIAFLSAAASV